MDARWWPAVTVATVVLVFSLVPLGGGGAAGGAGGVVVLGVGADKLLHVVDYAALAFALGYGLRARTPAALLSAFVVAVAVGGAVELLQGPLPTRATSLADAAANTLGAALGTGGWWLVGARDF
jgi:hypothetical protein